MRPPKLTPEFRARLTRIAIERRRLPSNKELARQAQVSVSAIEKCMQAALLGSSINTELLRMTAASLSYSADILLPHGSDVQGTS